MELEKSQELEGSSPPNASAPADAIESLKADHEKVRGMFSQFAEIKDGVSDQEKGALVGKIVEELNIHETVENEVFFPAVKQVLRKNDVLDEATEDQEDAGDAIQELGELKPTDSGYDEQVKKLGDQIAAHASEEERDVFPKVEHSDIDTADLGAKMDARKSALKEESGR